MIKKNSIAPEIKEIKILPTKVQQFCFETRGSRRGTSDFLCYSYGCFRLPGEQLAYYSISPDANGPGERALLRLRRDIPCG